MGKLLVSLDGKVIAEYGLFGERQTIGRLPDNDIHLDHLAVSGHHAVITRAGHTHTVEDLNSTNGTYVNGRLTSKYDLEDGDVIIIGRYHIKFVAGGDEDDMPADENDITQPGRSTIGQRLPGQLPRGKIELLSGTFAGRELPLDKALTTLGRPGVSVAAVTRRANGFFLASVEGDASQPPLVNDEPLSQSPYELQDQDTIELAGVKMRFHAL